MIPSQRHLFAIPRDVAYLNTAYMGPLMNSVVAACDQGVRMKATPWTLTIPDFYDPVDQARALFAGIVNAEPDGIAMVPSASYGIETAVRNLTLGDGRHVLTLHDQFPSQVYPWRRMARRDGGEVRQIAVPKGEAATEAVLDAITDATAIVSLGNVLWTNGAYIDLIRVRCACDRAGAALVLDLTQSAGALPIDFAKVRPDFAVAAAYKWLLCPYTTGFLYVAPQHRDGEPLEEGWITRKDSEKFSALVEYTDDYQPGAVRFDMGQRANFALTPGVLAALRQITDWGVENIYATLSARNAILCERLAALGLTPTPDHARGGHFIGAGLPKGAPADLLAQLAARNIFLSERGGSLRITPHLWNDDKDCDRLVEALEEVL